MATPLLTTKLYIPPVRPNLVERPRLIERLNEGLSRKLSNFARHGSTGFRPRWSTRIGDDWEIPDDRKGRGNKLIRMGLMVQ
jgi:hypothetical protein